MQSQLNQHTRFTHDISVIHCEFLKAYLMLHDDFSGKLNPAWHISEQGSGRVSVENSALHLRHPAHDASSYHNAQISDYDTSRQFKFKPPLRLSITAEASTADIRGTSGFGFWNHPFAPGESRFDVPQAVWFFFSSKESDMSLADAVPGHGWKAATFNAKQWSFFGLLPTAPIAMPLMNFQPAYDALWSIGQRAIGVSETLLDSQLLTEKHQYQIDWLPDKAIFYVDGEIVLEASDAITNNALGFVAWIDNQYAIVSPKGRFGSGFVTVAQDQSLILHEVKIETI